jgi:hypothetical protein
VISHSVKILRETPTRKNPTTRRLVHSSTLTLHLRTMSFPSPSQAPESFLTFLKTLNIDGAVTVFVHYRNQPVPGPNGRFKEDSAQNWCEWMDVLLVSSYHLNCYGRIIGYLPCTGQIESRSGLAPRSPGRIRCPPRTMHQDHWPRRDSVGQSKSVG